jgi:hypothetical protein
VQAARYVTRVARRAAEPRRTAAPAGMSSGARIAAAAAMLVAHGAAAAGPQAATSPPPKPSTKQFDQLTLGGLSQAALESPPPGFVASRWPQNASATLSASEFGLGRLSTGAHVDFETDASVLTIAWTLKFCLANDSIVEGGQPFGASCFTRSPSQTDTGGSGVDLFAIDGQAWRHVQASSIWFQGTGFGPNPHTHNTRGAFSFAVSGIGPPATRHFRLYLPLHNAIGNGSITVNAGALLSPVPSPAKSSIVWLGGSAVMGAYVSRAGWAFPSVLSRWLGQDVINYGLQSEGGMAQRGGAGLMSLAIARQIIADMAGAPSAVAVVIDGTADMTAEQVTNGTVALVELLRGSTTFARTPIVLVEAPPQGSQWVLRNTTQATNAALRAQFSAVLKKHPGWRSGLHYVEGWRLYYSTTEQFRDADEVTDMDIRSPPWHGSPGPASSHLRQQPQPQPRSQEQQPPAPAVAMSGAPTDEGHYRLARFWEKALPPIIAGTAPSRPTTLPRATVPTGEYSAAAAAAIATAPITPLEHQQDRPVSVDRTEALTWTDVDDTPSGLRISGKGFNKTAALFSRLPLDANTVVGECSGVVDSASSMCEYIGMSHSRARAVTLTPPSPVIALPTLFQSRLRCGDTPSTALASTRSSRQMRRQSTCAGLRAAQPSCAADLTSRIQKTCL